MPDVAELTIVIPTLDEELSLPALLNDIAEQALPVNVEVIVVDGGSQDGTLDVCRRWSDDSRFALRLLETEPGRGLQMNAGAAAASASLLLFIHADSRLPSKQWLQRSWRLFCSALESHPSGHIASHHPLRFAPDSAQVSMAYYYFAAKSALNLPETVNGDQALWITKAFFNALGGFDTSLPYMEDARLARKIFAQGDWCLMDDYIQSSSRRFEVQGLARRQCLNGLLRLFDAAGCPEFFSRAHDAYLHQSVAERLQLRRFLAVANTAIWSSGLIVGFRRGLSLGQVAAGQIWQIAFFADAWRSRRRGLAPSQASRACLSFYQKRLAWMVESLPAATFCALGLGAMFAGAWLWCMLERRVSGPADLGNSIQRG